MVLWAGATDLEAERHGPAVAMQVHGAAREVVREIPAELLRNGRVNAQGQVETGLMVLMRTLAERYSPLEVESSTRSIAELINLRRIHGESMDSYLTRFDVLRNRAQNRGNMQMGIPGLAWMLLNGLRATPDVWDRALMPFNGNLPQDNAQLAMLIERLRRQGHLHEQHGIAQLGREAAMRQGAMGGNATFFFPTFQDNVNNGGGTGREDTTGGFAHYPVGEAGYDGGADATSCPMCGQYYGGEDSSETSSDDGHDSYFGESAAGNMDPNELGNVLHNDYHMSKKRWRRFQNKAPKRRRRFGKGNFGKGPAFASFLPARAFAGGKGKGGGGKSRRNPTDASGRVLRCHSCGSEEHLIKNCPNNRGAAHMATSSSTAAHLAMGSGGGAAPGGYAAMSSWHTRATDLDDLVQMLPKRSRHGDGGTSSDGRVEQLLPGASEPKHPPPTWAPTFPSSSAPPTWTATTAAPTMISGFTTVPASAPPRAVSVQSGTDQYSDVGSSASQTQADRRSAVERNVLGLSQLLHGGGRGAGGGFHFPWWHSDNPVDMVYHAKTRLKGGKAALLVDPGAHGNLVGSDTMAQLVAQAATFGHSSRRRRLPKQMSVEGVGKQAQVAQNEEEVAIGFRDDNGKLHLGKFSAPVIEGSALPPLWGRQSLAVQKAVLDLGNNRLVLPGPGGIDMRLSPGSMSLPLTLSESGHLLLEVHHFDGKQGGRSSEDVHTFSASKKTEGKTKLDGKGAQASN